MISFIPQAIDDFMSAYANSYKLYDLINILVTSIILVIAIALARKPINFIEDVNENVVRGFRSRSLLVVVLQGIMVLLLIFINGGFLLDLIPEDNWMIIWMFSYMTRYIFVIVIVVLNIVSYSKGKKLIIS